MSKIGTFAQRCMQKITGQQMLPQSIFRSFLMEVEEVFSGIDGESAGKADCVAGATSGNFAALDSNGNLADSDKKPSDFVAAGTALLLTNISFDGESEKLTFVVGDHTYEVSATDVTASES